MVWCVASGLQARAAGEAAGRLPLRAGLEACGLMPSTSVKTCGDLVGLLALVAARGSG
ncbi:MAG: hypothetical protein AB3X44_07120 [Leptothrix sp. (in: b-proteobacteria)]